jgi:hypothetical protein
MAQIIVFGGLILLGGYGLYTGNQIAQVGSLVLGIGGLFLEKMNFNGGSQ